MKRLIPALFALPLALVLAVTAWAQAPIATTVSGAFDDVVFDVETAIIGAGLVIEGTSNVGDMLERTKADVGGTETLFAGAQVFTFCSAIVSREVMEADAMNLQYCPYSIFVMARPDSAGEVSVGRRAYPEGPMDAVATLLDGIIAEALTGY